VKSSVFHFISYCVYGKPDNESRGQEQEEKCQIASVFSFTK